MCDLLPPTIHAVLTEAETYVALPFLAVIGWCTIQFIFCHTMQIVMTVNEIMKRKSDRKPKRRPKCPGPSLIDRFKEIFCNKPGKCRKIKPTRRVCNTLDEKKFNHWDDNDEYDDDEEEVEDEFIDED